MYLYYLISILDPRYSSGVSSPGRHVRTRLYFTSESHIHSLLTILGEGGLVESNDEQWQRAMEYVSEVHSLSFISNDFWTRQFLGKIKQRTRFLSKK